MATLEAEDRNDGSGGETESQMRRQVVPPHWYHQNGGDAHLMSIPEERNRASSASSMSYSSSEGGVVMESTSPPIPPWPVETAVTSLRRDVSTPPPPPTRWVIRTGSSDPVSPLTPQVKQFTPLPLRFVVPPDDFSRESSFSTLDGDDPILAPRAQPEFSNLLSKTLHQPFARHSFSDNDEAKASPPPARRSSKGLRHNKASSARAGKARGYGTTASTTTTASTAVQSQQLRRKEQYARAARRAYASTQHPHAQSMILAIAFLFVWSPNNIMAPNLTQMALYFGFTPSQRDLYLGANIAFATGVLSLPVSAAIGFVSDAVPSRKQLYALTVFVGGLSCVGTGLATNYATLYFARFVCGGCMSGSVPVAFSLLGDLFDTKDRNTASSGLTAMMGAGIITGQIYAGSVGDTSGWKAPFYLFGVLTMISSLFVLWFVQEPVRGAKEEALQQMLAGGKTYQRKLTLEGFFHAMTRNESNTILMWQGFFSSLPWGIIFVFLNDYLSQEQGLSVPDATVIVMMFGVGCAMGGILGGLWGQRLMGINRMLLPLFMSATTLMGIGPFLLLLNGSFDSASLLPCGYALAGGIVASLPSVNVRPCLINVNPPEARGAALTAANVIINLARGFGPSLVTMMKSIWNISRQASFNVTVVAFWIVSSIQLFFLAFTLPRDQDAMESELAQYVASEIGSGVAGSASQETPLVSDGSTSEVVSVDGGDDLSVVSIEERITSFDAGAARESIQFMEEVFRELGDGLRDTLHHSGSTVSGAQRRSWTTSAIPVGAEGGDQDGGRRRFASMDRERMEWREGGLQGDDYDDASSLGVDVEEEQDGTGVGAEPSRREDHFSRGPMPQGLGDSTLL